MTLTRFIIELFTFNYSLIFREDFNETELINKEINVGNLAAGVYFIRITADHGNMRIRWW